MWWDIVLANKIPPSLNCLIDKRARVAGEIAKTKRSLKEARSLHGIRVKIPQGELTKSILTCIRLYQVNGPVSKEVIDNFVITRHFDFDQQKSNGLSNKTGLGNLYHRGYLVRHHSAEIAEKGKGHATGSWTLSDKCNY
jgi:hypothetical protein